MAYTQGPWKVHDCGTDETPERGHLASDIWGTGPGEYPAIVARVYHCEDGSDANERLIAAAPELLAALRELMDWEGGGPSQYDENPREAAKVWNDAHAAIAKATKVYTQEVQ